MATVDATAARLDSHEAVYAFLVRIPLGSNLA